MPGQILCYRVATGATRVPNYSLRCSYHHTREKTTMPVDPQVADLNTKIARLLKEANEEDIVKILRSEESLVNRGATHVQNNNMRRPSETQ
jgi:hypothetical protein